MQAYYAMEKVLRGDNDGVLVYIAPTKALVNQIAAEVYARFTKNYRSTSRSIWAIHTRDYRINNPYGCQILVTVPDVLQILLLSPQLSKVWVPRLKRIIFDEVHSIGNLEGGVIWEQLLLITTVPIIALSATIGNAVEFHEVNRYSVLLTASGFLPSRDLMGFGVI
jgi:ATP-dependent RNA helicase DDX60